jgi:glutamyl-Q tRNA(Asp) synthetase
MTNGSSRPLMSLVTRFAPSPTGYLHVGHAFSALTAWRRARAAGGRRVRCRPEFASATLEDLAWLGIDWDGPVRVQSEHLSDYAAVLDDLRVRGLLYPCFCTRSDIQRQVIAAAPHGPDGGPLYPGTCRGLTETERAARMEQPYALRLDMARALIPGLTFEEEGEGIILADPARFGDVVLARKDTPSSYHLCVTHDDALQGVTLVTRGEDRKPATHLHRLLQALIAWPTPVYVHHRLLTDGSGRRLAKRDRPMTLRALRAAGVKPDDLREQLLSGAVTVSPPG